MTDRNLLGLGPALQYFREARRQAQLQAYVARFRGRSDALLPFEEVRDQLNLSNPRSRYLDEIPLEAIVGSVGRYRDFNRSFMPLADSDAQRWARLRMKVETEGLPPIDVYKVGDVYFVIDGNHRVSIARQLHAKTIEAYVTEFNTPVELAFEDDLDDVLLKGERAEMMAITGLDRLRPDVDFCVTAPTRYRELVEHIEVHRYYMGQERGEDVPMDEAVASWVDNVYCPAASAIREMNVLDDFPGRTVTDLYLWLKKHQHRLTGGDTAELQDSQAARDLQRSFSRTWRWQIVRTTYRLAQWLERVLVRRG